MSTLLMKQFIGRGIWIIYILFFIITLQNYWIQACYNFVRNWTQHHALRTIMLHDGRLFLSGQNEWTERLLHSWSPVTQNSILIFSCGDCTFALLRRRVSNHWDIKYHLGVRSCTSWSSGARSAALEASIDNKYQIYNKNQRIELYLNWRSY